MSMDDGYIELTARKYRAERELVSILWAHPGCWLRRLGECGITPAIFDDLSHRAVWVVAERGGRYGWQCDERLVGRLIRCMGLHWDDLDMRLVLWRYGPGDAARRGEIVVDEVIELAERLAKARRAYGELREALGWKSPPAVKAGADHPGRAAGGWQQSKALPTGKGVRT